jgi:hypothetical protein
MMTIVPTVSRPNRQKEVGANSLGQDEAEEEVSLINSSPHRYSQNKEKITFVVSLIVVAGVSAISPVLFAQSCFEVDQCEKAHRENLSQTTTQIHAHLATFVGTLWLREMVTLAFAYTQERDLRLVPVQMPPLSTTSALLCVCLFALFTLQLSTANGFAWVHTVSPTNSFRASWGFVHSLQYVFWQVEVPILLVLCGHCVLRRPLSEVSPPAIATSVYMYFAWWALIVESDWLRCCLVTCCFLIFIWTTWRVLHWAKRFLDVAPKFFPSRCARVLFVVWLNVLFACYGLLYLLEMFDVISSQLAYDTYAICDSSAKAVTCVFLAHFRSFEQRDALAIFVAVHKRMNRANLSILRSSCDYVIPCRFEETGECYIDGTSTDVASLERVVGRSLANVEFSELLHSQRDRELFKTHIKTGFQQEEEDLIREALSTTRVCVDEWCEGKWFQESPAVAAVFNYDIEVSVYGSSTQIVPVSIHLSSALGRYGNQDAGPQMMIALRMNYEPSPQGNCSTFRTSSESHFPITTCSAKPFVASLPNLPGELTSESNSSTSRLCKRSGEACDKKSEVQSSLKLMSSSSGNSALRRSSRPPRMGATTPSVKTLDSVSSSDYQAPEFGTQTIKPEVHDVATETSMVWEGQSFHCKCCAKPPIMPETKNRCDEYRLQISRSSFHSPHRPHNCSFVGFNGKWLLTNKPEGFSKFLAVLKIQDDIVIDADGETTTLKLHHNTGAITYEGGALTLENGMLIRTGKSGFRYCYARAQEQRQSDDQSDLEMTPLCLDREDLALIVKISN